MPRAIISDGGSHFYNRLVGLLMRKYGVIHKVGTPYHPPKQGQVELAIGRLNKSSRKSLTLIVRIGP